MGRRKAGRFSLVKGGKQARSAEFRKGKEVSAEKRNEVEFLYREEVHPEGGKEIFPGREGERREAALEGQVGPSKRRGNSTAEGPWRWKECLDPKCCRGGTGPGRKGIQYWGEVTRGGPFKLKESVVRIYPGRRQSAKRKKKGRGYVPRVRGEGQLSVQGTKDVKSPLLNQHTKHLTQGPDLFQVEGERKNPPQRPEKGRGGTPDGGLTRTGDQ